MIDGKIGIGAEAVNPKRTNPFLKPASLLLVGVAPQKLI
jgi:hypothetical protein